jgi:hypothetical protein
MDNVQKINICINIYQRHRILDLVYKIYCSVLGRE